MRWDAQSAGHESAEALPGLEVRGAVLERWPTPDFDGMSFLEVTARSALNKVPSGQAIMSDEWTINPYRGCQHACRYCFARNTHTYLDLDVGRDFDSRIVVKANIVDVLERELRTRARGVERVHLGTNTDPYQRAEGRYRLMPGIIQALARHGVSIAILTKGTLLRRDLSLLASVARDVPVSIAMSIAVFDAALQQSVEPGTPSTKARLETVRAVRDAGLDCSVFVMPVLPGLTDSDEHLDNAFSAIAAHGATSVAASALHLRPGARQWYLQWLEEAHPHLVPMYGRIYRGGTYASSEYRSWLAERIRPLRAAHRLERTEQAAGTGINAVHPRKRVVMQLPAQPAPATPALF